jgi:invasion protein IalB
MHDMKTWTVRGMTGTTLRAMLLGTALAAAGDAKAAQGGGSVPMLGGSGEAGDPQVTTATYQDWLVRCVTPPSAAKVCEATQTIQVQGQNGQPGGAIAVIAMGRLTAEGPLRVAVQVPAGVWLPAGAKLQAGEKAKPAALEFKRCAQGCFAEVEADKDLELALRTATGTGTLSFEDGARRAVNVPFSFKGFAAALDAALKTR